MPPHAAPPNLNVLERYVWYADRLREAGIAIDPQLDNDAIAALYRDIYNLPALAATNGNHPREDSGDTAQLQVETWAQFERSATEHIPTLVNGLWPEGALGFIAAPPKKGKTWLGLSLAISVATGRPLLNSFTVPEPATVVYLALEGHRAAIRGRIGCLARGLGLNPDQGHDLDLLHIIYKPRGLNLNSPRWVTLVRDTVHTLEARLLIVDVLRRAARIKENSNDDFNAFLDQIEPIRDNGCSISLLHHFGKVTEITKERSPGERMSGAGSMQGGYDVGVFITGSSDGARTLRIECELRDIADPEPLGVHLAGTPTGVNGGFIYTDDAYWQASEPPDEDDLTANSATVIAWLEQQPGQIATTAELRLAFDISDRTITRRRQSWIAAGIEWTPGKGTGPATYSLADSPAPLLVRRVQTSNRAAQESLDLQEEDPFASADRTYTDTDVPPDKETDDLQDNSLYGVRTSPTEMQPPADAPAAELRADQTPDPDELALPAGTLDEPEQP